MVMVWANVFNIIAAAAGGFALIMAISNLMFMHRFSLRPFMKNGPKVSVLIPARDEETHIITCLDSLLDQTYINYEIIVLDDQSTDSTLSLLQEYSKQHPKITIIKGKPLPSGWYGKNHALHQLACRATGDIYLFTDADTVHTPDSVAFAATNMEYHSVSFLSGYPRQNYPSTLVASVLSVLFLNLMFFTPIWLHKRKPLPAFSLALGQYLCIRAEAYKAVGGYAAIPNVITDDIHIGRLLNKNGYRQIFLNVGSVVSCTMYQDFPSAAKGLTKCIFDFFDKKIVLLVILVPLFVSVTVLPYLQFFHCLLLTPLGIPFSLYFGIASLFLSWALVLLYNHFPLRVAALQLWSFSLIILLLLQGIYQTLTDKGFLWKNRLVK